MLQRELRDAERSRKGLLSSVPFLHALLIGVGLLTVKSPETKAGNWLQVEGKVLFSLS